MAANSCWAFGAARHPHPRLFGAVSAALCASSFRVESLGSQGVANVAWAYAKVGQADAALFASLERAALLHLLELLQHSQQLSNTLWAFATLGHRAPALFGAVADAATAADGSGEQLLASLGPQAVANLAWSYATAAHRADALHDALAATAVRRLPACRAADLPFLLSAFSLSHRPAPQLFEAAAPLVATGLAAGHFSPPQLASLALAFAAADQATPALLEALSEAAARQAGAFRLDAFATLSWSFAVAAGALPEAAAAGAERFLAAARRAPRSFVNRPHTQLSAEEAEEAAPQLARLWQVQLWLETEVARQLPRSPVALGRSRLPTHLVEHGRAALVASEAAAADGLSPRDALAASGGSAGGSASRSAAAEARAQQALREGGARRQRLSRLSFALHMGGEAHTSELRLEEGYTIDLALEARRVAVVVAGRAQYDQLPRADGTYAPTTAARLGWRQLGALGWEVVLVPWFEWDALDSTAERRAYIDERLRRAGGAAPEAGGAPAGADPAGPAEAAEAAAAADRAHVEGGEGGEGGEAQRAGLQTVEALESELKAARARISELERLLASGPPRD